MSVAFFVVLLYFKMTKNKMAANLVLFSRFLTNVCIVPWLFVAHNNQQWYNVKIVACTWYLFFVFSRKFLKLSWGAIYVDHQAKFCCDRSNGWRKLSEAGFTMFQLRHFLMTKNWRPWGKKVLIKVNIFFNFKVKVFIWRSCSCPTVVLNF